jgi:hypothetical protein
VASGSSGAVAKACLASQKNLKCSSPRFSSQSSKLVCCIITDDVFIGDKSYEKAANTLNHSNQTACRKPERCRKQITSFRSQQMSWAGSGMEAVAFLLLHNVSWHLNTEQSDITKIKDSHSWWRGIRCHRARNKYLCTG